MSAHTPLRPIAAAALAVLVTSVVIGCPGESAPVNSADSSGPRVISLSPALTQMVKDLQQPERIVGVGTFDPVAPETAHVVGDLRHIDYELLLALQPTAVLLQPGQAGVPGRLKTLADRAEFAVHSFDIETLDDALTALTEGVGEAVARTDAAAELADRVRRQMKQLATLTEQHERPRVLLLVGLSPYATAAAPGTFLDEALHAAGAQNALPEGPLLYPELDHEQLLALDAEVMIHLTAEPSGRTAGAPIELPEPIADRLKVLEHPAALLPSTALPRVVAAMIELIHPELHEKAERIATPKPGSPPRHGGTEAEHRAGAVAEPINRWSGQ